MKTKFPLLPMAAIVSITALGFLAACTPTLECGSWAFSGNPVTVPYDGFNVTSAFTFTPATCGKSCDCTQDVMIQMVSVYDSVSETYLYPTSSYADRATSYGWVIDRVDGEGYGYYSLINNGTTFFSGWNTPGANGTANTLFDLPGGWPDNTYFYSVDVATCFNSQACQNKILGYYFWSWTSNNTGTISQFIVGPAWKDLDTTFQNALAGWNAWAPASGPENGSSYAGDFTSLPHAVVFPTLSDL